MGAAAAIDLCIFRSVVTVIACQRTDFANLDALLVLLDISSQCEITLCNSLILETVQTLRKASSWLCLPKALQLVFF